MAVTVRKIPGAEFSQDIYEMQETCFPGEQFVHVDNTNYWWLAHVDQEIAGYACLSPSTDKEYTGYLSHCAVLPAFRGHGLQRRLIRARLAQARRNGWPTLVTDTTDNPHSANNLIACGFKLYRPKKPWGQSHTNYWRLRM